MSTLPAPQFDPESFHPRGNRKWWQLRLARRRVVLLGISGLIVMGFLLWPLLAARTLTAQNASASSTKTVPAVISSPSPSPSLSPSPSSVPPSATLSSTPTEFILVPTQDLPVSPNEGVIVMALREGAHTHLFAYQPEFLPFTRLTYGPWDDIMPAISPDGNLLAFSSNRNGYWNLYVLELTTGQVLQITDSTDYEAAPSWSPDGLWLAYESYSPENEGGLDIYIRSIEDGNPIRLTDESAADHSPAWSSQGRVLAFVSDRSGEPEIWLADLDKVGEERFTNISRNLVSSEAHPTWSPDGSKLAWAADEDGYRGLYIWDSSLPIDNGDKPAYIGTGDQPVWNPDGDRIFSALAAPNQSYLVSYDINTTGLVLPAIKLPGDVAGLSWGRASLNAPLPPTLQEAALAQPSPLWLPALTPFPDIPNGRMQVVLLEDVEAPQPYLHDMVDESFQALRAEIARISGWDFLFNLENAYTPLTASLAPGFVEDWLYTGRAFAFSTLPLNADWLSIVREDFGPHTYWRVYVRARFQDGSAGMPLHTLPWDFAARHSGSTSDYESGGALAQSMPPGYWIDFTSLAARYGWERLPALSLWGASYSAARFNEFVHSGGLDWRSAMLELYPIEVLITPTAIIPPTRTLTPTNYWYKSPTPSLTSTPRPTLTPLAPSTLTPSPTASITTTPTPREAIP
jgi:TolB protein